MSALSPEICGGLQMIQGVRNIMHDSKEKEIILTLNLIAHYIMKNESQLGNCACIEVHIRTASSLSITYIGNYTMTIISFMLWYLNNIILHFRQSLHLQGQSHWAECLRPPTLSSWLVGFKMHSRFFHNRPLSSLIPSITSSALDAPLQHSPSSPDVLDVIPFFLPFGAGN